MQIWLEAEIGVCVRSMQPMGGNKEIICRDVTQSGDHLQPGFFLIVLSGDEPEFVFHLEIRLESRFWQRSEWERCRGVEAQDGARSLRLISFLALPDHHIP